MDFFRNALVTFARNGRGRYFNPVRMGTTSAEPSTAPERAAFIAVRSSAPASRASLNISAEVTLEPTRAPAAVAPVAPPMRPPIMLVPTNASRLPTPCAILPVKVSSGGSGPMYCSATSRICSAIAKPGLSSTGFCRTSSARLEMRLLNSTIGSTVSRSFRSWGRRSAAARSPLAVFSCASLIRVSSSVRLRASSSMTLSAASL